MNRIKALREQHEKTQQDLANFLNLSQKAVSFYELGQRDIPNDVLKKLADYFHVSTDYILGREEKRLPFAAALPVVGNIIKTLAALSPQKQEQAASYIAFLAQDDKKA